SMLRRIAFSSRPIASMASMRSLTIPVAPSCASATSGTRITAIAAPIHVRYVIPALLKNLQAHERHIGEPVAAVGLVEIVIGHDDHAAKHADAQLQMLGRVGVV